MACCCTAAAAALQPSLPLGPTRGCASAAADRSHVPEPYHSTHHQTTLRLIHTHLQIEHQLLALGQDGQQAAAGAIVLLVRLRHHRQGGRCAGVRSTSGWHRQQSHGPQAEHACGKEAGATQGWQFQSTMRRPAVAWSGCQRSATPSCMRAHSHAVAAAQDTPTPLFPSAPPGAPSAAARGPTAAQSAPRGCRCRCRGAGRQGPWTGWCPRRGSARCAATRETDQGE